MSENIILMARKLVKRLMSGGIVENTVSLSIAGTKSNENLFKGKQVK